MLSRGSAEAGRAKRVIGGPRTGQGPRIPAPDLAVRINDIGQLGRFRTEEPRHRANTIAQHGARRRHTAQRRHHQRALRRRPHPALYPRRFHQTGQRRAHKRWLVPRLSRQPPQRQGIQHSCQIWNREAAVIANRRR